MADREGADVRTAAEAKDDQPVNDTINLVSGDFWGRDSHAELRWMCDNAPVYWDPAGEAGSRRDVRTGSARGAAVVSRGPS